MKRLIILFLVICSTICDLESCAEEEDHTKCSTHVLDGIDGFSCRLFTSTYLEEDSEMCSIYPDSAEDQKIYWKLINGEIKESLSAQKAYIREYLDEIKIPEPTKNYFAQDEAIELKGKSLTNDEKKEILNANSCAYLYAGRFLENPEVERNITDKNTCFNAYQFSELKNLINCGYSTMTCDKSGTKLTVNTCFYIPDNHLPDNEKALFNQLYVALGMNSIIESYSYEGPSDLKSKQKKIPGRIRKLASEDIQCELVVEDKYGKKYKYVKGKVEPEVIEEGLQGDRIYSSNTSKTELNKISLLLLIISLILF